MWTSLKSLRKTNCNQADGYLGNLYISSSPGFSEDPAYWYHLTKSLYDILSVDRALFQTMSTFLKLEDCTKVGYEESMWKTTVHGHDILLTAHIDDFIIASRDQPTLDTFLARILNHFNGPYEGAQKETSKPT